LGPAVKRLIQIFVELQVSYLMREMGMFKKNGFNMTKGLNRDPICEWKSHSEEF